MIQNYKYQASATIDQHSTTVYFNELPKKSSDLFEVYLIKSKTEMETRWIWGRKISAILINPHYLIPQ